MTHREKLALYAPLPERRADRHLQLIHGVLAQLVKMPLRVLIVEDSEFDAQMMVNMLRKGGYDVVFERAETADHLRKALHDRAWDMILADYNLPEFNAPAALKILQETGLDLPFIIVSGGIGEDIAVSAMKSGAHDYLMKGNLSRLVPAVERGPSRRPGACPTGPPRRS